MNNRGSSQVMLVVSLALMGLSLLGFLSMGFLDDLITAQHKQLGSPDPALIEVLQETSRQPEVQVKEHPIWMGVMQDDNHLRVLQLHFLPDTKTTTAGQLLITYKAFFESKDVSNVYPSTTANYQVQGSTLVLSNVNGTQDWISSLLKLPIEHWDAKGFSSRDTDNDLLQFQVYSDQGQQDTIKQYLLEQKQSTLTHQVLTELNKQFAWLQQDHPWVLLILKLLLPTTLMIVVWVYLNRQRFHDGM